MAKPFRKWTVLPHGALEPLADNIVSVTGLLHMPPMGEVERRMTVVRLADDRLVFFSAIALREPEMDQLAAFGEPAYLIVPNGIHRMDARAYKERFPSLRVIAPAGARAQVEKVVPVDATAVDFGDPNVRFVTLAGTDEAEGALIVQSPNATTLVLNDLVFDLPNREGLKGWLFKKAGMTGDEPHIPPVIRMKLVKDRAALRRQLERWAELPNLKHVIIAHGGIIDHDAPRVLERIAHDLAA